MLIGNHEVHGKVIDHATRCEHYHSELDIIAIKFACCHAYYPCYRCHQEAAGHAAKVWPKSAGKMKAILCGNCHRELTIETYKGTNTCPYCHAAFNPDCNLHYHYYFG
ncbi:CHY zinc finger protein [Sediminibacillus halophilus]|uniref:Uncharacterized protein, contains Zn-finger domain of CHY type n=1 Tax=Sediminibacillus halophilus TaxID=482461 RepID=A0A1G9M6Z0_9BACI|nr:CHY zinc finger protein [Sediminibacillus halophilus]SDL69894.1 Uncharacterized protein, contains Zn-finger domain of CHY type [Sediminibacillus halophilus]